MQPRGAGSSPRIPNTFEAPKTEVGPIKYISDDRVIGPRVTAFGASIFRRAATLTNRLFSVRPRGLVCEPRLGKRERDRRPSSSLFLPSPAPPPCQRKLLKFLGASSDRGDIPTSQAWSGAIFDINVLRLAMFDPDQNASANDGGSEADCDLCAERGQRDPDLLCDAATNERRIAAQILFLVIQVAQLEPTYCPPFVQDPTGSGP